MAALGGRCHALLQDYGIPNSPFSADAPDLFHQSIGYYVAAVVGIAIIAVITLLVSRLVAAREDKHSSDHDDCSKVGIGRNLILPW